MPHHLPQPKQLAGFGLIEIMITLSIVATIILYTEAPANAFYNTQDTAAVRQNFLDQLRFARSEARLRHKVVRVCQSDNFSTCSNQPNWRNGWIIYVDLDNDGARSSAEPVLSGENPLRKAISVRLVAGGHVKSIKIDSWGVIRTSGRIEVCSERMDKPTQIISFTRSGYLRRGEKSTVCVM